MNKEIKDGLKDASVQAAEKGLSLFGKWLLTRPRVKKLLAKFGVKP